MQKFTNRAFLALLLAALLAIPAGVARWSHKETTAYYENRTLAERPALTLSSLWDGSFGIAFESWYSDHIPGRTALLKADTRVQMDILDRPVVNDVVLEAGDVLVPFQEYAEQTDAEYAEAAVPIADGFGKLNAHIEANGGVFRYVGFLEQRFYFADRYPDYLDSHETESAAADAIFAQALADRGVSFLDMGAVYEAQGNPAEYYSTVDHHYNYYGAYAAYRAILDDLNAAGFDLPVLTEADLDFVELPNPYIGTRNRKLYNLWPNDDHIVLGIQKDPVAFDRRDNGQPSGTPLFVTPSSAAEPVAYGVYMGGDYGETVLETHRPELPKLLIFGDSFTNALETLLYASFDETRSLDLRHYQGGSLKDYIADYRPDVVLCVLNDSFYYTTAGNGAVWED